MYFSPRDVVAHAVDKALEIQQPAIDVYVQRLRRWRPESPELAIRLAEKQYLSSVTAIGAAAGGGAAAPGVGIPVAVAVSTIEIGAFTAATATYIMTVATIHGIDLDDIERRKFLLYNIMLGTSGSQAFEKVAGRTGKHWARLLVNAIDPKKLRAVNRVLGRNFVTKYGTRQGLLVLGRAVPFGIGAGIGGAGNAGLGYLTVRAARAAFGPGPSAWGTPTTPGDDPSDDNDLTAELVSA